MVEFIVSVSFFEGSFESLVKGMRVSPGIAVQMKDNYAPLPQVTHWATETRP